MTPAARAAALVRAHGRTLAEEGGVDLADEPGPLWQLLVLVTLLSKRISSGVALRTARELWAQGWRTPGDLRASTWDARVAALGRGGYRRYDFSTATRLDAMAATLVERWDGDLRALRTEAGGDRRRLVALLRQFDGIGPTGAGIYVREVQAVWPEFRPYLDTLALEGARLAGLPTDADVLADLVPAQDVASLASALVRVAREKRVRDEVLADGPADG